MSESDDCVGIHVVACPSHTCDVPKLQSDQRVGVPVDDLQREIDADLQRTAEARRYARAHIERS